MLPAVFISILSGAVLVSIGAMVLVGRDRTKPGAEPLLLTLGGVVWWLTCYLGQLLVESTSLMFALARVQQLGVVVIPLAWTIFVFEYTGRGTLLTRPRIAALAVVPVVTAAGSLLAYDGAVLRGVTVTRSGGISAVTGEFGPIFHLFSVYMWIVVTGSAILLAEFVLEQRSLYKGRALALLGAGFIPTVTNFLETMSLVGDDVFRLTPLTFAASVGLATLAIVEFDMFRTAAVPSHLASETAMSTIEDPTFVLDGERTVVDCNPAAVALTDTARSTLVGSSARNVPALAAVDRESAGSTVTIETAEGTEHYDVQSAAVDDDEHVFGRVVTFREVTDRRERKQRLDALNDVLRATIQEEMTTVKRTVDEEADGSDVADLRDRASLALDMTDRAGELASMVDPNAESPADIVPIIHEEIDAARELHPDVSFVLDATLGEWAYCSGLFEPVFRVSLRHAAQRSLQTDAEPVVGISISAGPESVTVSVSDRGPALTDHERAVLCDGAEPTPSDRADMSRWLVNWGIEQAGGRILVGTDGEHTSIELTFPRTDAE